MAPCPHSGQHSLHAPHRAEEIRFEHHPPVNDWCLFDRAVNHLTGVVHEHVDRARLVESCRDRQVVINVEREKPQRHSSLARCVQQPGAVTNRIRMVATTVSPSRASRSAVAKPIPVEHPVTSAVAMGRV